MHRAQPLADRLLPLQETRGKRRAGCRFHVRKLAGQRTDRATALILSVNLQLNNGVAPGLQRLHAVQMAKQRLLCAQHLLRLEQDDGLHQLSLLFEVVIKLGGADLGFLLYILHARSGNAAFEHQSGGGRDDAAARFFSLLCELLFRVDCCHRVLHELSISKMELSIQK
ncbi:hypothetical protein D3C74_294130 [compost metagenome]